MIESREFNPSDIRWIKSVTRNNGTSWAYMDVSLGDTFALNFSKNPKWFPTNYLKPKPGEIIALFQTLKPTRDWVGGSYVTHLVSPIDFQLGMDSLSAHPYTRLVTVVACNSNPVLADTENWSFYKCNRGQICNINTIERRTLPDSSFEDKQKFIWNLFETIDTKLRNRLSHLELPDWSIEDYAALEGQERTILRLHRIRERDSQIIAQAKNAAIKENRLFCEICLFDFAKRYPTLGDNFIECHHKQPISKGGLRETKLSDLALVCANCHRMLHRKYFTGHYLTVDELRKIVNQREL